MLLFPLDRLPVIKVVLSYLKTNPSGSHTFRISWRSQGTLTHLLKYSIVSICLPGNTALHFIITDTYFLLNSDSEWARSCFCINNPKLFVFGPRIHCYVSG